MRKRSVLILAVLVISALIVATLAGCGSKTASVEDPLELFSSARDKLKTAESFSVKGTVGVSMPSGGDSLLQMPGNIEVPFTGAVQKTNGKADAKISLDIGFLSDILGPMLEGFGMGTIPETMDIYVIADKLYFQNPLDGNWYFADANMLAQSGLPDTFTNQDYAALLEVTENVKVVSETDAIVKYEANIDVDKFFPENLDELLSSFGSADMSPQELQAMVDELRQTLASMVVDITVDKKSGYPTALGFTLDLSMQDLGSLGGGLVDVGENVIVTFGVDLADFGKSQNIKLPDAARNAQSADSLLEDFPLMGI